MTEIDTTIRQRTEEFKLTTALGRIEILEARYLEPQDRPTEAGSSKRDADMSRDGDNSHGSGTDRKRQVPTQRECTYTGFLKCQPMNFKGTEGVVGLTQWVEKMESVFLISNCTIAGQDVAYAMPWTALKRMITDKYYPRGEIKKLESEYWNLRELAKVERPCAQKCTNYKKIVHSAHDCNGRPAATNNNNHRAQGINPRGIACFECGVPGHFRSDCLKLKNGNQGNQAGNGNVVAKAYAIGTTRKNPNSNVVTGTLLLNNRYALILFDTGADRSFVSVALSSLNDIIPTTLDYGYNVELANDRIIWVNTLIRGLYFEFSKPSIQHRLDARRDGNNGHESRFNIISCTKSQKYFLKGCPIFLAHVTMKKAEDKLKEKRLEDVPIVQDFLKKLLKDLQIINKELTECNHPTLFDDNEDHSVQYKECPSNEIATSNSNQEKEKPLQDSDIRKLIREEWCIEVCEEQRQKIENTILELVEICRQKELYCMHDNVDDLIKSALNSKLLLINSQRLNKEKHEVKNVVEQPAERRTLAPILSTKEPEYSPSMGYEHPNTTPKTESDEIIKSGVEDLVLIPNECEVTSEDKRECDVPVCENSTICDDHSEIFFDSNNDDDILSDDDDFKDIEYVEASLLDPEIVSVEEENVVYHEDEEFDLEEIQDVVLREKLLSINHFIANIESLNDNPTPDRVLNSFVSFPISEEFDNSLSDNSSPEFETFCDHTEKTRSGNTTTHIDDSLPEYDSFCFEIEPDQERLINVVKNDISDDSTNDPLLEEADLFLAFDNSIPPGIENFAYDSEGDIRFLEELLIDDSIPFPNNESSRSDFDNLSFPRPPSKPPDADFEPDT
nr:hypothetical protein [Tanacetum cinerariifolium]